MWQTHDDFPLPVAPMMAFRPGFIIPLRNGGKGVIKTLNNTNST